MIIPWSAHAKFTLKGIIETLGIPYYHLHTAGNDANYTMRVFLVLMAQSMRRMFPESTQWSTVANIQSIALGSIDAEVRNHLQRAERARLEQKLRQWLEIRLSDIYGPWDRGSIDAPYPPSTIDERHSTPHRIHSRNLDLTSLPSVLLGHDSRNLLQAVLFPAKNDTISTRSSHSNVTPSATLFVAFHLDFFRRCNNRRDDRDFSHIQTAGFSSFDTRYLKNLSTTTREILPTKNLSIAPNNSPGTFRFLFGESIPLTQKSLIETFQSYISQHESSHRVILVGWNINRALCVLRNSGFDLPNIFSSSIPIIDIKALTSAKGIRLNASAPNDISGLMQALDFEHVPARFVSEAGNVTHFLLKSLLILAIRDFHDSHAGEDLNAYQVSRIQALESIARTSAEDKWSSFTPDRLACQRREECEALKQMKKDAKNACCLERPNSDWEDNLGGGFDIELGEESIHDSSMFADLFE